MKKAKFFLFLIFLLLSAGVNSQDNVTNELKKIEIIGSFLYNNENGSTYFVSSDCENQKILKLEFDNNNWAYDTRNLGGNKLQQKMTLAIIGKEKMKIIEKAEINSLANMGVLMGKVFEFSNNPFEAISGNLNKQGTFYIDPRNNYTQLKEGEYLPTFDGNVKIVTGESYLVFFKTNKNDEEVEIFNGDLKDFNSKTVTSISYNQVIGNFAITTKTENGFLIRYYNAKEKKFFPEKTETQFNFCRVGQILKGFNLVNSAESITKIDVDNRSLLIKKVEISEINKKGEFETSKKPQLTIDTLNKSQKDWFEFLYKGGRYKYNDSLWGFGNFDNYTFTGYYADTKQSLTLTSMPYDPRMQAQDYLNEKMDFKELIEMCPNAPEVVSKIELLNQKLETIKRQGLIDNAKIKRYQFVIEEVKDVSGMDITNIKILKDCKIYDLNDSTNRNGLKELVNEVRGAREKAIDDLSETIIQYNNLSKSVKNLCSAIQDIDTGGSKLLGSLTKIADKSAKGVLLATLVSTTTKATELFNSYKAAKEQLDNAKKAIDNYKSVTQ